MKLRDLEIASISVKYGIGIDLEKKLGKNAILFGL
jgi:hypothetical protein